MKNEIISTRNLGAIPDIDELNKICRAIAVLEKIITSGYGLFYLENESNSEKINTSFGIYFLHQPFEKCKLYFWENGSGDFFRIIFNKYGAMIVGFNHESNMSPWGGKNEILGREISVWPGLIDKVPWEFSEYLKLFIYHGYKLYSITYCIWRKYSDNSWKIGNIEFDKIIAPFDPDPDGSEEALFFLNGQPEAYLEFAETHGEKFIDEIAKGDIKYILDNKPLNEALIKKINPNLDLETIRADIEKIGYPIEENL
jgi:hypothetical protein